VAMAGMLPDPSSLVFVQYCGDLSGTP